MHILNNWYSSSSSRDFSIQHGVSQGTILSPILYSVFVDDLLDTFTSSCYGVTIDSICCRAPIYADDIYSSHQ